MTTAKEYYNASNVEGTPIPTTGIISIMTGDQLHPVMVDDVEIWENGQRWEEGARECVRILSNMAGIRNGEVVLDVGCGVGGPTRLLAQEYTPRVIGLNISRNQIKTAKDLTKTNEINYVTGDVQQMPIIDSSIDIVFSMNMFYNVQDKAKAAREIARVLKDGGKAALDDWNSTVRTSQKDLDLLGSHFYNGNKLETPESYQKYLEDAGLRIVKVIDVGHIGRSHMRVYFQQTFDASFRPKIEVIDPEYGKRTADDFVEAVNTTIEFYERGKMTYTRMVAVKT